MNTTAEVYMWGTRIGILHENIQRTYASFEYDPDFIESGIEVSPLRMPLSTVVYEFPELSGSPFYGLPGLVADSLPDKFGNEVISKWLHSTDKAYDDFSPIDRLCYTGKRGMGALEYVPSTSLMDDINENIIVSEMVKFAEEVLSNRKKISFDAKEKLTYEQLVQTGSSAGGARAKAIIAWNKKTNEVRSGQTDTDSDFDYWIMKFDNVSKNGDYGIEDIPEYTLIEYAYYLMAVSCGITMNECRIYESEGNHHFMTKRFDRKDGRKIHMQSLGSLAHISYLEPAICGYEQAAAYMKRIGLKYKETEQFYRRMVFNCIAVNQDDHVKNISFLMDRSGIWTLSPAYDITFSFDSSNRWLKAHQMTVNGKTNDIKTADLITSGKTMGIKQSRCMEIIEEITLAVTHFPGFAQRAGLREKTSDSINFVLKKNLSDMQK